MPAAGSGIGDLLSSDGSIVSEENEKAEVFNEFLVAC